ncbi:hypothetical protein VUR80DRAFT_886 [Thermomyces stellatus]
MDCGEYSCRCYRGTFLAFPKPKLAVVRTRCTSPFCMSLGRLEVSLLSTTVPHLYPPFKNSFCFLLIPQWSWGSFLVKLSELSRGSVPLMSCSTCAGTLPASRAEKPSRAYMHPYDRDPSAGSLLAQRRPVCQLTSPAKDLALSFWFRDSGKTIEEEAGVIHDGKVDAKMRL